MPDSATPEPRTHSVRWLAEDWETIEKAAQILGERERVEITPTDIIRSGAIRRAEEIVAEAEATA